MELSGYRLRFESDKEYLDYHTDDFESAKSQFIYWYKSLNASCDSFYITLTDAVTNELYADFQKKNNMIIGFSWSILGELPVIEFAE